MKTPRYRKALTLLEVLVVLSLIAIVVLLLVPAIARARESARLVSCKSNLGALGFDFHAFADKDPNGRLSSGAYDPQRNGCIATTGWVADVVDSRTGSPPRLYCPSNSLGGLEGLNDYLGGQSSLGPAATTPERIFPVVVASMNGAAACGTTLSDWRGTNMATSVRQMLNRGYGTNYTASYFFVRIGPRTSRVGSSAMSKPGFRQFKAGDHIGALTRRYVEASRISSSTIPLLGDAAAGAAARASVEPHFVAGDRLGSSFSAGPAVWDGARIVAPPDCGVDVLQMDVQRLPTPEDPRGVAYQGQPPRSEPPTSLNTGSLMWLQDYRAFGSVHAGADGRICNILMADGSVTHFVDQNGDGLLNPGFEVVKGTENGQGYTDGTVELHPALMYTGVWLHDVRPRICY